MAGKIKTKEQLLETFQKIHSEGWQINLCAYEDAWALRKLCSPGSELGAFADALETQGKTTRAKNLREEMEGVGFVTADTIFFTLRELHDLQMNDRCLKDPEIRNRLTADLSLAPNVVRNLEEEDLLGVCYLRLLEEQGGQRNHVALIRNTEPYTRVLHEIAVLQDPETEAGKLVDRIRFSPEKMDLRDKEWCDALLDYLNYLSKRYNVLGCNWKGGNRFCYSARIWKACREAGLNVELWEREKTLCSRRGRMAKDILKLAEDVKAYRDALCSTEDEGGGFMLEGSYYLWAYTDFSVMDCVRSTPGKDYLPVHERKILVQDDLAESDALVAYSDSLWELLCTAKESWETGRRG